MLPLNAPDVSKYTLLSITCSHTSSEAEVHHGLSPLRLVVPACTETLLSTAASRGPAHPQADLRAEPQATAQRGQVVTGSRERAGTSAGGCVKVAGAKTGEHETGEHGIKARK